MDMAHFMQYYKMDDCHIKEHDRTHLNIDTAMNCQVFGKELFTIRCRQAIRYKPFSPHCKSSPNHRIQYRGLMPLQYFHSPPQ